MRSASFAEWIIARFTNRSRAVSIVGDLLETRPQKGSVWFWMSVARVVLSLTWRSPLAYLAALCFGFVSIRALNFSVLGRYSAHHATLSFFGLFSDLSRLGLFLSFGLTYTAIRFGLRDSLVRHILGAWALIVAVVFYGTIPVVAISGAALGVCLVAYSATSAQRRKGLLAFAVATSVGAGFVLLSSYLFLATNFIMLGGRPGTIVMVGTKIVFAFELFVLLILTIIFSWAHRKYLENDSPDGPQLSVANS
jgi:hypothetical protein